MTKFLIGMISIYLAFSNSLVAQNLKTNESVTFIKNAWVADIKVKEGLFEPPATVVPQGQFLNLIAPYNVLFNLAIKYKNNIGQWLKIPGCPEGNFFSALTVEITVNSFSPDVPLCTWSPI